LPHFLRARKQICRVCLNTTTQMVDIFGQKPKSGIPISDLILQCTGNTVKKEDSHPDYICMSCLDEVQDASEIIGTFKRSHHFFCQLKEQKDREEDAPEEEAGRPLDDGDDIYTIDLISDQSNDSDSEADNCPVKNEPIDEYIYEDEEIEKLGECNKDNEIINFDIVVKEDEELRENEDTISEGITISDEDEDETQFKCQFCPKSFKTKIGLIRHNILHSDELPFKCPHCPKKFRRKANHKEHVLSHSKERQLKCNLCPRTFMRIRYLEEHLLAHRGERPHKCEVCSKDFRRLRDLKRHHVETHMQERPFQCPNCKKSFGRNTTLTLHMDTHYRENRELS
ncbi:hypothetical protein KR074_001342, partial [Drosophila pseudoananassae]